MEDNSTLSIFGVDLGGLFSGVAQKYAQDKGYKDLNDLAVGETAKNVGRLIDKPGQDVKQTPAVIQPGEWSKQISAALPIKLNLSNAQIAIGAVVIVGAIILIMRK